MADPTPPANDIRIITDQLAALSRRVSDLERPSGTQNFQAVANLQIALNELAAQQATLEAQQNTLEAQQLELGDTVGDLAATVAFLQGQTVYAANAGGMGGVRTGSVGINYESYSGTYDCSLSVTTGASGKLLISTGAVVLSSGGGAGVGPEIVGVLLPSHPHSMFVGGGPTAGASRTFLASLTANTTYTIRSRRWWYGSTSQTVLYENSTLAVTRLG